jgi:hypothetical protein
LTVDLVAERFHLALHAADQLVDLAGVDVALAAGMADSAFQLSAVEGLALTVFLDDGEVAQLDPFERCKARAAPLALSPTADRRPVLGRAAVLHLAVFMRAERTAHPLSLINREAGAKLADAAVHFALDRAVVVDTVRP